MKPLYLITILYILVIYHAAGQGSFQKKYGTNLTEAESYYYKLSTGDAILAGHSGTPGSFDIYVIKLDENHNILWSKTFGSTSYYEGIRGFSELENGNYLITGIGKGGNSTVWLLLSPDGNLLSNLEFGSSHDRLKSNLITNSGDVLIYGELQGIVGSLNQFSVAKVDANLNISWKKSYYKPSIHDAELQSRWAAASPDGGFIFLGSWQQLSSSVSKQQLLKIDNLGNVQWVKEFHGGGRDDARSFVTTQNEDGYIIISVTNSFSGSNDILVTRTNLNGQIVWARTYGGFGNEDGFSIYKGNDGTYLIAGYTTSFGFGGKDAFLLKINNSGSLLWAKTYGSEKDESFWSVTGTSGGYIISGDANDDFFLVKTDNNGISSCEMDVTSNTFVSTVTLTETSTAYNTESFNIPAAGSLNSSLVTTESTDECINCDPGEKILKEMCEGESFLVSYEDKNASSYTWSDGSTEALKELNSAGTFWVDYVIEGCTIRDSIEVVTNKLPVFDLGSDTTLCLGEKLHLTINMENASYLWSDGSDNLDYEVTKPENVWLEVKKNNCTFSDSINIFYLEEPSVDLGPDIELCEGSQVVLKVNGTNIRWQDGGTENEKIINTAGMYKVTTENKCGVSSDSLQITSINLENLILPNVITPNGDDKNEYFMVDERIKGSEISIYNRWGRLVYHNNNYDNLWQGFNLPAGTYFYYIESNCIDNLKGFIHVIY